jgi:hypothetical protein
MFQGTIIDQLIAAVARVEEHAQQHAAVAMPTAAAEGCAGGTAANVPAELLAGVA